MASLVEDPASGEIVRFDFAVEAWEGGRRPPKPARIIAVWRAAASTGEPKRSLLVGTDEMLALFEGMDEEAEGRAVVFRYLLSLLLMRKRVLRLVDQRQGDSGRPVLQLARRGGPAGAAPQTYEVVDPGMDEEAVAVGMQELSAIVGGEAGAP